MSDVMLKVLDGMNFTQVGFVTQVAAQLNPNSTTVDETTSATLPETGKITLKKKGAVSANAKATRPLNSYIAFRSYYSKMFPGLQQKEISGFLTFLWHQDNSKAMWTVLAKAYSIIRDSVGKENAPLELFLAVNAPFIGIIGPQDYLIVLGYELTTKKNGELALTPLDGMESISRSSNGYFPTSMSVDDIVCNSVACGYVDGHQLHLTMPGDQAVLTMAIPAPAPAQAQPNQDVPAETYTDEEFMNDLSKELARIDSEMRVIAEVADATEGVVDLHEEPVAAPDLNMSPPSPHGWNLDSFTYDPFQGDPFNAFDLGVGTNEFDDSEFSALLDDYFL